ncbi:MAG: RNase H family protein [Pseudomonadota bacterium]
MSGWRRYRFKGRQKAWVRIDDAGEPLVRAGRIEVAFKRGDDRTYQAGVATIEAIPDAEEFSSEAWTAKQAEASKAAPEPAATVEEPEVPESSLPATHRRRRPAAIKAWTDGACFGNPGPSAAGALLRFKKREKELSVYLGEGTNNTAELEAIRLALLAIKDRHLPVDLHTDSSYALGVLTLGWRPKANREMVSEIRELVRSFDDLRIIKVKGHAGVEENERVDVLAKRAITAATGREPTS